MTRRANGEGSKPIQRKDGRWQVGIRYTVDGVAKRTSVTGRTAKEARERAQAVRDRLRADLPAKDRKEALGAFTERWIVSTLAASDRKATTKTMYATMARKHIIGASIGAMTIDRLKPSHVEAWKVELQGRGLSESTIRSAYTILRAILDTAVRDDALGKNPAAAVARPKVTRTEAAHLTGAEVRRVIEAAAGGRYALLFDLLVNTGLRRGEALALRWSDVDFTKRLIRVRGTLARIDGALVVTPPKTEKSRRVLPMSDEAERILRALKVRQAEERLKAGSVWVRTDFVFTTETGEPSDPRNALRAFKVAAERAGLPSGIGLHTLRHSAATIMLEKGVPLKIVSELWGHHSVSITGDIYGHVSPNVSAQAMDVLGKAIGGE